jgi:hypothetical protein
LRSGWLRLLRGAGLLACVASAPAGYAWDDFGHRLVASAAYSQLDAATRARVDKILGGGKDAFQEASVWADTITATRPETRSWHYVNFPLSADAYDRNRDCPQDNCVVARLEEYIGVLRSDAADEHQREALRFVIHLTADIHQPLHCADLRDRGGNDFPLLWDGIRINLHQLWDHYVMSNSITEVKEADATGDAASWCNESHAIARDVAYVGLPEKNEAVSEDYKQKARAAAASQLAKAAARLARVLNESLKPSRYLSGSLAIFSQLPSGLSAISNPSEDMNWSMVRLVPRMRAHTSRQGCAFAHSISTRTNSWPMPLRCQSSPTAMVSSAAPSSA